MLLEPDMFVLFFLIKRNEFTTKQKLSFGKEAFNYFILVLPNEFCLIMHTLVHSAYNIFSCD